MLTLNRNQVREVDRRAMAEYGLSGLVLMENAGRGVADVLCTLIDASSPRPSPKGRGRSVAICCGKGNNGGDGFVVARHLDLRGVPVRVALFADPAELTGDAAANFRVLQKCGVPIAVFSAAGWLGSSAASPQLSAAGGSLRSTPATPAEATAELDAELASAVWIVDALLGTGAVGPPRSPYDWAISRINAAGKPVLAVDLPSGLDCDTGVANEPTIVATHTCTFVRFMERHGGRSLQE